MEAVYIQKPASLFAFPRRLAARWDALLPDGEDGLVRNLTPGEIAGQVAVLAREHSLVANDYNLIFMGMGEPLNNYDQVLAAFRLLTDPQGFGIAARHITLSTAGVVPGIRRLALEDLRPRLAVSLSATTDALRNELMPINRAYPLAELFESLRELPLAPREKVTLEYVLLRGMNDRWEDAQRLASLAGRLPLKVNLIPYNEAYRDGYAATPGVGPFISGRPVEPEDPASIRRRRGRMSPPAGNWPFWIRPLWASDLVA